MDIRGLKGKLLCKLGRHDVRQKTISNIGVLGICNRCGKHIVVRSTLLKKVKI